MLVLLIVFMVSAPLMTVGIPIQLPKSETARSSQPKPPIIVTVDQDGQTFLGDEALPADVLHARLQVLATSDPQAVAYVRGDRRLAYGAVMAVMDQVSRAGFAKVVLLAERAVANRGPS
jgi:biopolymer transport protein ExbD